MKRSTLRIRTATALRAEALTHVRGGSDISPQPEPPATETLRLDDPLTARANTIGLVANVLSAIGETQTGIVGNLK